MRVVTCKIRQVCAYCIADINPGDRMITRPGSGAHFEQIHEGCYEAWWQLRNKQLGRKTR